MKDIKMSLKKKNKKERKYGGERYKKLSEDEKQKLVEYGKEYYRMKKKNRVIIKSNDLKTSFEAINLLQKAYLNKTF